MTATKPTADDFSTPIPIGVILSLPDDEPKNIKQGEPPFVDLRPYLDGDHEPEKPAIGEIWPGQFLFYRGRLNELHGEPATGKTNVLIAACNAVIRAGGSVLYLDPEDTPRGFASRCISLGGNRDDIATRCHYLHNPTPDEILAAQLWAGDHAPALVALDGLAESLAAEGLDENTPGDILKFFRERLRPFAEAGSAVVIADHVTKSTEGRGRWARGSGAKLGRYDGLVLGVELGKAYTPEEPGFLRLRIAKDRNGGAGAAGDVLAEVHFTPGLETTAVEFRPPQPKADFRPTAIMEKIIKHLEIYDTATKTELRKMGNHEWADKAIDTLVIEGAITVTRQGQKMTFSLPTP